MSNLIGLAHGSKPPLSRYRLLARKLTLFAAVAVLNACGGGDSGGGSTSVGANDNSAQLATDLSGQLGTSFTNVGGVMELTISGLGTNRPQTEVKWDTGAAGKSLAATTPLPLFLDVASQATNVVDSGGFRYIAATVKVRNAQSCGTPGSCPAYASPRNNVTFFAVMMPGTINQTALSRFNRFDGTPAAAALTTQFLPANGVSGFNGSIDPQLSSFQAYTESELPTPDAGVTSVFPYGFVVRNVNNGSRVLPANPAAGVYDGVVTFAFRIPIQPLPTDDPFKISIRLQSADDLNTRVTQSILEQNFAGDASATSRAISLSSLDVAVLGGRVTQTNIGNPICRLRIAGTAASPTAFLVDQIPNPPSVSAAPMNLHAIVRNADLSVGFCETMNAPTASTLFAHGSMSGQRVVGSAYSASFGGGGVSNRRNQLILTPLTRAYHRNEFVSVTATAGNTTTSSVPITPFVARYRVAGAVAGSLGTFGAQVASAMGTSPDGLAIGDLDGDGRLDVVTANRNSNNISVRLGTVGGLGAVNSFAMGVDPKSVVLGDLNGDGNLDVLTANDAPGTVSYRLGDGTGGFGSTTTLAAGNFLVGGIALGDVNGDGRLDIVTANRGSASVTIWLSSGAGTFGVPVSLAQGSGPQFVHLADVNNDGKLDIVTSHTAGDVVRVRLGNGNGTFAAAISSNVGNGPLRIALGDLNGDGILDLVTPNSAGHDITVLRGIGDGTFVVTSTISAGAGTGPVMAVLGDVNGDGVLDLAIANGNSVAGNSVSVYAGNGAGGFNSATVYPLGTNPISVELADMDLDGQLDIIATNSGANTVSVLQGN